MPKTIVKEVEIYKCSTCGKEYTELCDAMECEESHKCPCEKQDFYRLGYYLYYNKERNQMNALIPPMTPKSSPVSFKSNKEFNRAVKKEMEKLEPEYFKKHAEQLIPQLYAMVLYTLSTCEGYGEKRLKRFCEHIHDIDELMDNPSRLHHRFDPTDLIEVVKEKYGIDVVKEFPVRTEVQK